MFFLIIWHHDGQPTDMFLERGGEMDRMNLKASRCGSLLCAGLIVIFFSVLAHAQTTGTLLGTVTDSTAAAVPGAAVRATNVETGISRATVTNAAGRYRIPELGLGLYSVEAQITGFQTEVRSGIRLTVGREAVVDLELKVGAITERVEVTAEAPLVQTKDSAVSYLVDENTMRDLPLNGRSYTQLATLQPNVISNTNYSKHLTAGTGLNLIVQGQRPGANLFLLDGTEANDFVGKTPGGLAGATLGVEAIREFSLLTGNFSAEYGHFMGGVVNVATRSGTNTFHGNLFYFLRNSALDAKNFFDRLDFPIPAFKRNNLGATFGGPLLKDRAFFFTNYEGLRERKGLTEIARVPNAASRRGSLPSGPVDVNPAILPLLNAWPVSNGRDYGDGTGEYIGNPLYSAGDNYGVFRTDFQLSNSHSLFARYTISDSNSSRPENPPVFLSSNRGRNQFLTLSETAILNPTTLNVFSAGFNRTGGFFDSTDLASFPPGFTWLSQVDAVGGWQIRSPAMSQAVGGGTRMEKPRYYYLTAYEINDKVSRQQGAHSLTMGGTLKQYDFVGFSTHQSYLGRVAFDTLQDFLRARPITFLGAPEGRDPQRSFRQHLLGLFIQDDIQVTSNLTLNLGLRWEFVTSPRERNGKMTGLANPDRDRDLIFRKDNIYEATKKNFAPRFGFAWDPFSNGKTSVRGGASIFHNILTANALELARPMATQAPFLRAITLSGGNIAFPRGLDTPSGGAASTAMDTYLFDPVAQAPTRYFWTLGIQHELVSNTVMGATYSGSRAAHLIVTGNRNTAIPNLDANGQKFFPTGLLPRNPAWNLLDWREYGGNAYYQALAVSVVRRFTQGFQGQLAYTWSKNLDNASATFSGAEVANNSGSIQDFYNRAAEKGRSSFDVRQNFVANINWDLPLGSYTGAAQKLLDGWQVSTILARSTGVPFTAQAGFAGLSRSFPPVSSGGTDRPNLAAGRSNNPVLGGPDQYFDPTAFELQPAGYFGNAGRGTISGPGFFNLDFSVKKNTQLTESTRLEFRAELFNILNHPNFGVVSTGLFAASRARLASAGRITNTWNDSRQIQFGLKLNF